MDTGVSTPVLPGLVVRQIPRRRPTVRRAYYLNGTGGALRYIVHNNSLINVQRGIAERVLYIKSNDGTYAPPVRPAAGVFQERLMEFQRNLRRHLSPTTPILRDEFPLLYRGRRQKVYEDAAVGLRLRPVERRDSYLKAFVKAEKILHSAYYVRDSIEGKDDPAPRIIQPRDPRYNVEVGKYLKPCEGRLYKAIGKVWGGVTVAKGLNAKQRGALVEKKWKYFNNPVAVGLDASRFDQHVSADALRWEHGIYNWLFKDKELRKLLDWQICNKGSARTKDGKVQYTVRGCRMSGDMNTALGNCLIMSALVFAYCRQNRVKSQLLNDGDDCVVFMEKHSLNRFSNGLDLWFREMGFKMKVEEPAYRIENIEFCQCRPVLTEEGYLMVRNVRQSLAKDSLSLKPLDNAQIFKKWCNEVGNCGLSLTGGIPVVSEFYKLLQRASCGVSSGRLGYDPVFESGMRMMAKGMDRHNKVITDRTRFSFWLAFGIEPDVQLEWEAYYRNATLSYTEHHLIYETSPSFNLASSIPQAFCYF